MTGLSQCRPPSAIKTMRYSTWSVTEVPNFEISFSLLDFAHFRKRWQVGPEKIGLSVIIQFSYSSFGPTFSK